MKKLFSNYKKTLTPPYHKSDFPVIGVVLLVFLLTAIIFSITGKETHLKSYAQVMDNTFEPENGTFNGDIMVVNDPNASGGKYVLLGTIPTATPGVPTPTAPSGVCMSPKDNLFLNPFNKMSAQHRPVGSGAVYATDDDAATVAWKKGSAIYINIGKNWGDVFTQSQASDPTVTVSGNGPGLPVTMKIPAGSGGTTSDAEADVYDPTTGTLNEFYKLIASGNGYTSLLRRASSIRGLGHGLPQTGVTASGMSVVVGLLRGSEANTAGYRIEHVLNLTVPSRPGDMGGVEMLSQQIVWPATSKDGFCSVVGNCNGAIPYGALMAIPPESQGGPNLNSLGLSEPGRRVAQALRGYGAYVTDSSGGVTMRADQTLDSGVSGQIRNDLAKIYSYMRMIKNNSSADTVAGGGNQLVPNCAFDAP